MEKANSSNMQLSDRIKLFVDLGKTLRDFDPNKNELLISNARLENPWFTRDSIEKAFGGVAELCEEDHIVQWTSRYDLENIRSRKIGLILAGNIPMVGFHDIMCVLLSGHHAIIKLSSQDSVLVQFVLKLLVSLNKESTSLFTIVEKLQGYDAVIATGSDNTSRYFEYYFKDSPHIIRKNRTSVAVLTGSETENQLLKLGDDVFSYFGMGCRNVTKLYVPEDYDMVKLLDTWSPFEPIIHHNKYRNNYDYHKSILLVNKEPHLDTGFSLLRETKQLVAPLSVLFYERYKNIDHVLKQLQTQSDKIQCVVSSENLSKNSVAFGDTQRPKPWDYADGVDTLSFLSTL